jgi:NADH-quinone oxidoreductase subunit L
MEQVFSIAWLIIVLPIVGLLINLIFGRRIGEREIGVVASLAAGASFLVSLLVVIALLGLSPEARVQGVDVPLWTFFSIGDTTVEFGLKLDALSATMLMVVTFVGTLIHIYAIGYMHGDPRIQRFFIYMNLFMAAMLTLVLGNNYLMLFFGWEGVGLCSFLLIGFWFEKDANSDAARKAMVANRLGDYGVMLAMLALFVGVGTLQFGGVFEAAEHGHIAPWLAVTITLLLFVGVTGKSAQIPLYVWLPDAMAGPTPVSALIHAATMVTAGVYLIARSEPIFHLVPEVQGLIAIVGAVTALFAGSVALAQFDIKKVLAYSTVSQLGFMVCAVGMGATVAGIFHLGTHAFFKALLFLGAGSVIHGVEHGLHHLHVRGDSSHPPSSSGASSSGDDSYSAAHGESFDPQDMRNMGGLWHRMRTTAVVYIIGALALAGIVPLAGFWSKDEILLEASHLNQVAYLLLLIAAAFTAFYMTRQVLMIFFGRPKSEAAGHASESPKVMTTPLMILAFFAVTIGLINAPGLSLFSIWLEGEAHGAFDLGVAALSTALALGAIALGYFIYRPRETAEGAPDDPLRATGPVFGFLSAKYYIDEGYDTLFIRPFKWGARVLADVIDWRFWHDFFHDTVVARTFKVGAHWLSFPIDKGVVDRFFDGIGVVIGRSAGMLRRIQTGYVRNYALVVLLGVVAIVIWFASRVLGQ